MKRLWIIVFILSLVYVAVWAGMRASNASNKAVSSPTPIATPDASTNGLVERAKADAIGRSPSNATIEVVSVVPAKFVGPQLEKTKITDSAGKPGFVITLMAQVEGKDVTKLVYHASSGTVVFISQSAP